MTKPNVLVQFRPRRCRYPVPLNLLTTNMLLYRPRRQADRNNFLMMK